jgi:hypothetical protein
MHTRAVTLTLCVDIMYIMYCIKSIPTEWKAVLPVEGLHYKGCTVDLLSVRAPFYLWRHLNSAYCPRYKSFRIVDMGPDVYAVLRRANSHPNPSTAP